MRTIAFVHRQDGDAFVGCVLDDPDDCTQDDSLDDPSDLLIDLDRDPTSGERPGIREVDHWSRESG